MTIENEHWHSYLGHYQRYSTELKSAATPSSLYHAAIQLSQQRLALNIAPPILISADTAAAMPAAIWQTELLLFYARHYALSRNNKLLLLLAGWNTALYKDIHRSALTAPALATAKYLAGYSRAEKISRLLSFCYPTERKITPWCQDILSLLLTEADYLYGADPAERQQAMASRIMRTSSEYELALLRTVLAELAHSTTETRLSASMLTGQNMLQKLEQASNYTKLIQADNRNLEHCLHAEPQLASSLLAIASRLNRQQQSVTQIRLAINLIGRDNLTDSLAIAELHDYLSRLKHPWQPTLLQFCHCMSHALQLVTSLPFVRCQLLVSCLMAPLWLNESYARVALVRRVSATYQSNLNPIKIVQSEAYLAQVAVVLKLYHLNAFIRPTSQWQRYVSQQQQPTDAEAISLQHAWQLSLQLFCGIQIGALPETGNALAAKPDYRKWLTELAVQSQCYSPLQLEL